MSGIKYSLQHYLNPVHVYCRLRDLGLDRDRAKTICAAYERYIYRVLPLIGA